jgi:hypothetical protein
VRIAAKNGNGAEKFFGLRERVSTASGQAEFF